MFGSFVSIEGSWRAYCFTWKRKGQGLGEGKGGRANSEYEHDEVVNVLANTSPWNDGVALGMRDCSGSKAGGCVIMCLCKTVDQIC
jgi:hypothetical protein